MKYSLAVSDEKNYICTQHLVSLPRTSTLPPTPTPFRHHFDLHNCRICKCSQFLVFLRFVLIHLYPFKNIRVIFPWSLTKFPHLLTFLTCRVSGTLIIDPSNHTTNWYVLIGNCNGKHQTRYVERRKQENCSFSHAWKTTWGLSRHWTVFWMKRVDHHRNNLWRDVLYMDTQWEDACLKEIDSDKRK